MKKANAISPQTMKAAGRVNNPIVIRMPQTSSMMPAHQNGQVPTGTRGPVGHPNSFWVAWQMNSSPKTIRNRLSTVGVTAFRRESSLLMIRR